jgi:hypothetical protein
LRGQAPERLVLRDPVRVRAQVRPVQAPVQAQRPVRVQRVLQRQGQAQQVPQVRRVLLQEA